jgi:hypothetical protein
MSPDKVDMPASMVAPACLIATAYGMKTLA